jgi:hypothetical protein
MFFSHIFHIHHSSGQNYHHTKRPPQNGENETDEPVEKWIVEIEARYNSYHNNPDERRRRFEEFVWYMP